MLDLQNSTFNFLDIETTGLRLSRDRVIEVFATKEQNGTIIDTFHSLINPGFAPDRFILKLTNIPLKELNEAPNFELIAPKLFEFLNEGILVAHNARFDYSFLKTEFAQLNMNLNIDYCCTVKMMKKLYPGYRKHNLDIVRGIVGVDDKNKHRAESDTEVIRKFYYYSIENFGVEKVQDSMSYSMKNSAIPERLLKYDFKSIPETPGVYIFYGKEDYPLYVGMSNNLKRRVKDHLYSDTSYSKDSLINQQLTRIETIPTAGTLGAALRESYLVKKLEPLYNVKLRRNKTMIKVKEEITESGYKTIKIDSNAGIEKNEIEGLILISQNLRNLKELLDRFVKENGLCSKLLGLEKGSGACFAHQLGKCKGACMNKISPEEYNNIFDLVFKNFKIKKWPYNTPIVVTEESSDLCEEFIIDNWIFLGSNKGLGEQDRISKFSFNFDTYKILNRFLIDNPILQIEKFKKKKMERQLYFNFFSE